jgi:enoyl-[acyl-carrier protein] reductase I
MVKGNKYWAIIVGGSQGLGYASARYLAEDGFNLIIIHRDFRTELDAINRKFEDLKSNGIEVVSFNKDGTKEDTINDVFLFIKEKHLKIKVLLHSIAKGNLKLMTGDNSLNLNDFQQTIHAMGINFYEWSKALVDSECYAEHTKLLAFTSEGNAKVGLGYGAVSAAKVTLESIMKQMAVEFAPLGFTANSVQAGMTDTESFRKIPQAEQLKTYALKRNPFKRLTTPDDVGKVVSLLASDKANWINGTIIPVDGGERLS